MKENFCSFWRNENKIAKINGKSGLEDCLPEDYGKAEGNCSRESTFCTGGWTIEKAGSRLFAWELCHLRHHDHSRAFHLLLEHLLTDHLLKLMDSAPASDSASPTPSSEVKMASTIVHAAAKSKAQFPIDHVCSTLIRRYKLIWTD